VILKIVRYGLPAALVLASLVMLVAVQGSLRYDGFAMLLGSGLSVAFLNLLPGLFPRGGGAPEEEMGREPRRPHYLSVPPGAFGDKGLGARLLPARRSRPRRAEELRPSARARRTTVARGRSRTARAKSSRLNERSVHDRGGQPSAGGCSVVEGLAP
jgi:hypothetical protein